MIPHRLSRRPHPNATGPTTTVAALPVRAVVSCDPGRQGARPPQVGASYPAHRVRATLGVRPVRPATTLPDQQSEFMQPYRKDTTKLRIYGSLYGRSSMDATQVNAFGSRGGAASQPTATPAVFAAISAMDMKR